MKVLVDELKERTGKIRLGKCERVIILSTAIFVEHFDLFSIRPQ